MKTILELKGKRSKALADARAANDQAAKENRNLTEEEKANYTTAMNDYHDLGEQIERAEVLEREELRMAEIVTQRVDQNMSSDGRGGFGAPAEFFRDSTTGETLRALRHGETMTSDREISGFGLGALCRDLITGEKHISPEARAVQIDADTQGGVLLSASGTGRVWDLARAASVVSAAGAQTVPVHGRETSIAKITADPTASWVPEGSSIPLDAAMQFGAVRARLRKIAIRIEVSDEMLRFSNSAAPIQTACTTALAQEIDRAALSGTGDGEEPVGIEATSGVLTDAAAGGAIDWDELIDQHQALAAVNVSPNSFIVSPTVNAFLAKLKDSNLAYQNAPGDLAGLKKHVTSKLTASVVVMGEFKNLLLLPQSKGLRIDLVNDIQSGRGMHILQIIGYLDVACVWPSHFHVLTGISS